MQVPEGHKPEGYLEFPPGEIQAQFMSSEKAHQLLGWTPVYSLREGLEDTYYWYKHFLLGKKDMKKVNDELIEKFTQKQQLDKTPSAHILKFSTDPEKKQKTKIESETAICSKSVMTTSKLLG